MRHLVALLSLTIFLIQSILAPLAEANIWEERRATQVASLPSSFSLPPLQKPSILSSKKTPSVHVNSSSLETLLSSIPEQVGSIRRVVKSKESSSRVVIQVQDIHSNLEAQKNISLAIQALMKTGQVDVLGLEGGFETFDFSRYYSFPHKAALQVALDYLLKTNDISGGFHAGLMMRKASVETVGVDHKDHYQLNVKAVRDSKSHLQARQIEWSQAIKENEEKKASIFSSSLFDFDQKIQAHRKGRLPFGSYVETLSQYGDVKPTSSVGQFLQALKLEKEMDFDRVNRERDRFLSNFVPKLNQSQMSRLTRQTLAFRSGRLSQADFYEFLLSLCREARVELASYKSFDSYIRYVLLSKKIDGRALFAQIQNLENQVYRDLAENKEERELVARSRVLYLEGKLLDFSLSPQEWEEYKEFRSSSPVGEDTGGGPTGRAGHLPTKWGGKEELSSFEEFYHQAEKRDQAMVDNLLQAMNQKKGKVAVLVAGGFHSPGIESLLQKEDVSIVQFTPQITKVASLKGVDHLSVFAQEKTPLEKLFEGEKLFLAKSPATPFATRFGLPHFALAAYDHAKPGQTSADEDREFVQSLGSNELKNSYQSKSDHVESDQVHITSIFEKGRRFIVRVFFGSDGQIQRHDVENVLALSQNPNSILFVYLRWLNPTMTNDQLMRLKRIGLGWVAIVEAPALLLMAVFFGPWVTIPFLIFFSTLHVYLGGKISSRGSLFLSWLTHMALFLPYIALSFYPFLLLFVLVYVLHIAIDALLLFRREPQELTEEPTQDESQDETGVEERSHWDSSWPEPSEEDLNQARGILDILFGFNVAEGISIPDSGNELLRLVQDAFFDLYRGTEEEEEMGRRIFRSFYFLDPEVTGLLFSGLGMGQHGVLQMMLFDENAQPTVEVGMIEKALALGVRGYFEETEVIRNGRTYGLRDQLGGLNHFMFEGGYVPIPLRARLILATNEFAWLPLLVSRDQKRLFKDISTDQVQALVRGLLPLEAASGRRQLSSFDMKKIILNIPVVTYKEAYAGLSEETKKELNEKGLAPNGDTEHPHWRPEWKKPSDDLIRRANKFIDSLAWGSDETITTLGNVFANDMMNTELTGERGALVLRALYYVDPDLTGAILVSIGDDIHGIWAAILHDGEKFRMEEDIVVAMFRHGVTGFLEKRTVIRSGKTVVFVPKLAGISRLVTQDYMPFHLSKAIIKGCDIFEWYTYLSSELREKLTGDKSSKRGTTLKFDAGAPSERPPEGRVDGRAVGKLVLLDDSLYEIGQLDLNEPSIVAMSHIETSRLPQKPREEWQLRGLISYEQGETSHAQFFAQTALRIPHARFPGPDRLRTYEGQWVVFLVDGKEVIIREATTSEIDLAKKSRLSPLAPVQIPQATIESGEAVAQAGSVGLVDHHQVGPKVANLEKYSRALQQMFIDMVAICCAPTASITFRGFVRVLEANGKWDEYRELVGDLARHPLSRVSERLDRIWTLIMNLELEEILPPDVLAGFILNGVFVRPSTNVEDLRDAPGIGAGGYQTTPHVVREEDLILAIKEGWASLWNEPMYWQRYNVGINPMQVFAAIGLNPSIYADYAFAFQTARQNDPDHQVLEVVQGLGESLLGSDPDFKGDPTRIIVNKKKGTADVVSRNKKTMKAVLSPGGGLSKEQVDSKQDFLDLPFEVQEAIIKGLNQAAAVAERTFGQPQLLEGTIRRPRNEGDKWVIEFVQSVAFGTKIAPNSILYIFLLRLFPIPTQSQMRWIRALGIGWVVLVEGPALLLFSLMYGPIALPLLLFVFSALHAFLRTSRSQNKAFLKRTMAHFILFSPYLLIPISMRLFPVEVTMGLLILVYLVHVIVDIVLSGRIAGAMLLEFNEEKYKSVGEIRVKPEPRKYFIGKANAFLGVKADNFVQRFRRQLSRGKRELSKEDLEEIEKFKRALDLINKFIEDPTIHPGFQDEEPDALKMGCQACSGMVLAPIFQSVGLDFEIVSIIVPTEGPRIMPNGHAVIRIKVAGTQFIVDTTAHQFEYIEMLEDYKKVVGRLSIGDLQVYPEALRQRMGVVVVPVDKSGGYSKYPFYDYGNNVIFVRRFSPQNSLPPQSGELPHNDMMSYTGLLIDSKNRELVRIDAPFQQHGVYMKGIKGNDKRPLIPIWNFVGIVMSILLDKDLSFEEGGIEVHLLDRMKVLETPIEEIKNIRHLKLAQVDQSGAVEMTVQFVNGDIHYYSFEPRGKLKGVVKLDSETSKPPLPSVWSRLSPYLLISVYALLEEWVARAVLVEVLFPLIFGQGSTFVPIVLFALIFATLMHPIIIMGRTENRGPPSTLRRVALRLYLFVFALSFGFFGSLLPISSFTTYVILGLLHVMVSVVSRFLSQRNKNINIPIPMAFQRDTYLYQLFQTARTPRAPVTSMVPYLAVDRDAGDLRMSFISQIRYLQGKLKKVYEEMFDRISADQMSPDRVQKELSRHLGEIFDYQERIRVLSSMMNFHMHKLDLFMAHSIYPTGDCAICEYASDPMAASLVDRYPKGRVEVRRLAIRVSDLKIVDFDDVERDERLHSFISIKVREKGTRRVLHHFVVGMADGQVFNEERSEVRIQDYRTYVKEVRKIYDQRLDRDEDERDSARAQHQLYSLRLQQRLISARQRLMDIQIYNEDAAESSVQLEKKNRAFDVFWEQLLDVTQRYNERHRVRDVIETLKVIVSINDYTITPSDLSRLRTATSLILYPQTQSSKELAELQVAIELSVSILEAKIAEAQGFRSVPKWAERRAIRYFKSLKEREWDVESQILLAFYRASKETAIRWHADNDHDYIALARRYKELLSKKEIKFKIEADELLWELFYRLGLLPRGKDTVALNVLGGGNPIPYTKTRMVNLDLRGGYVWGSRTVASTFRRSGVKLPESILRLNYRGEIIKAFERIEQIQQLIESRDLRLSTYLLRFTEDWFLYYAAQRAHGEDRFVEALSRHIAEVAHPSAFFIVYRHDDDVLTPRVFNERGKFDVLPFLLPPEAYAILAKTFEWDPQGFSITDDVRTDFGGQIEVYSNVDVLPPTSANMSNLRYLKARLTNDSFEPSMWNTLWSVPFLEGIPLSLAAFSFLSSHFYVLGLLYLVYFFGRHIYLRTKLVQQGKISISSLIFGSLNDLVVVSAYFIVPVFMPSLYWMTWGALLLHFVIDAYWMSRDSIRDLKYQEIKKLRNITRGQFVPKTLRRFFDRKLVDDIYDPREKNQIYETARRNFRNSDIRQVLEESGIESYVLYVVSGMAPNRIAVRDHSDLDLTLAVNVTSLDQYNSLVERLKTTKGFKFMETAKVQAQSTVVRFRVTQELDSLGVEDTIDLNVKVMFPLGANQADDNFYIERVFDFTRPMAVLLEKGFIRQRVVHALLSRLLGKDSSQFAARSRKLEEILGDMWFDAMAVDYYHMDVAGVDLLGMESVDRPGGLEAHRERVSGLYDADGPALSKFKVAFRKEVRTIKEFLKTPADTYLDRKFYRWETLRELGEFRIIKDRLNFIFQSISEEQIKRTMDYVDEVHKASKVEFKRFIGSLLKILYEDAQMTFSLTAPTVFQELFFASPEKVESEFGISKDILFLSLVMSTLMAKEEQSMSVSGTKRAPNSILYFILLWSGIKLTPKNMKRIKQVGYAWVVLIEAPLLVVLAMTMNPWHLLVFLYAFSLLHVYIGSLGKNKSFGIMRMVRYSVLQRLFIHFVFFAPYFFLSYLQADLSLAGLILFIALVYAIHIIFDALVMFTSLFYGIKVRRKFLPIPVSIAEKIQSFFKPFKEANLKKLPFPLDDEDIEKLHQRLARLKNPEMLKLIEEAMATSLGDATNILYTYLGIKPVSTFAGEKLKMGMPNLGVTRKIIEFARALSALDSDVHFVDDPEKILNAIINVNPLKRMDPRLWNDEQAAYHSNFGTNYGPYLSRQREYFHYLVALTHGNEEELNEEASRPRLRSSGIALGFGPQAVLEFIEKNGTQIDDVVNHFSLPESSKELKKHAVWSLGRFIERKDQHDAIPAHLFFLPGFILPTDINNPHIETMGILGGYALAQLGEPFFQYKVYDVFGYLFLDPSLTESVLRDHLRDALKGVYTDLAKQLLMEAERYAQYKKWRLDAFFPFLRRATYNFTYVLPLSLADQSDVQPKETFRVQPPRFPSPNSLLYLFLLWLNPNPTPNQLKWFKRIGLVWVALIEAPGLIAAGFILDPISMGLLIGLFSLLHVALGSSLRNLWKHVLVFLPYAVLPFLANEPFFFWIVAAATALIHFGYDQRVMKNHHQDLIDLIPDADKLGLENQFEVKKYSDVQDADVALRFVRSSASLLNEVVALSKAKPSTSWGIVVVENDQVLDESVIQLAQRHQIKLVHQNELTLTVESIRTLLGGQGIKSLNAFIDKQAYGDLPIDVLEALQHLQQEIQLDVYLTMGALNKLMAVRVSLTKLIQHRLEKARLVGSQA